MGIESGLIKISKTVAAKSGIGATNAVRAAQNLQTLPKVLSNDVFERQIPKSVVKVYQTLLKNVVNGETVVSPDFGGCHGVGILQNGKLFFGHFPDFFSGRMEKAISQSLDKFQKGQAKVVFISPVSKGEQSRQFETYLKLIKEKLGDNINVETLTYPKTRGTSYTYNGTIKDGDIVSLLKKN